MRLCKNTNFAYYSNGGAVQTANAAFTNVEANGTESYPSYIEELSGNK